MFSSVLTQPLRIEMSPNETVGPMTMALPFRQKAMVKTLHSSEFSMFLRFAALRRHLGAFIVEIAEIPFM